MRHAVLVGLAIGLSGCTCADPSPTTAAPSAKADAAGSKRKKPVRGERADGPVMRRAEFVLPLQGLTDDDLATLRELVLAAATEADPDVTPDPDHTLTPWACREGRMWGLRADHPATATIWQRYGGEACAGTVDTWWAEIEQVSDKRPKSRAPLGAFALDVAGRRLVAREGGWSDRFETSHHIDNGKDAGAFPHPPTWLAEQLPDTMSPGKSARAFSQRWALARVRLAGEVIVVEADRWTCGSPDKPGDAVGAALRFRTNRRAAGHTSRAPKDVVVVARIQSFADHLVAQLGDRLADTPPTALAALGCAP